MQPRPGWALLSLATLMGFHRSSTVAAQQHEHSSLDDDPTVPLHVPVMLCNNNTDFQCVCAGDPAELDQPKIQKIARFKRSSTSKKPAKSQIARCETFMEIKDLPVVDMRLRHVNLQTIVKGSESYEVYFKRRIASIISAYCEHRANECPGVSLRLTKEEMMSPDGVLYNIDPSEPVITQENVIIVRVVPEPRNYTRIQFAVAKHGVFFKLNDKTLIDPVKIKYILGSQVGPLSRILGGIRIDSVRVSHIRRVLSKADTDNSKLLWLLYGVAAFFVICWTIGAIKIYRNREEKKRRAREKKASEENAIARKPVNDYGSIAPEQRSRSHSKSERGKSAEKNQIIKPNGSCREERPAAIIVGGYTEIDEPVSKTPSGPRIDDRAARQMFACDPSQLPKEMSFDVYDEAQLPVSDRVTPDSRGADTDAQYIIEARAPSSAVTPTDASADFSRSLTPTLDAVTQTNMMAPPVPILVMQPSSNSLFETSQLPDHNPASASSSTGFGCLLGADDPYARPASRRGSRADEIDIDEILDMRERRESMEKPSGIPLPSHLEKENKQNEEEWSSSEDEAEIYYKMSEDEEELGDDWKPLASKPKLQNGIPIRPQRESSREKKTTKSIRTYLIPKLQAMMKSKSPLFKPNPPRDTVTEVEAEEAPEDEGYAYERLPEEDIHATAP
ncbi:unnamed protein product, partial [Mesorhabditis spiculigera]